MKRGSLVRRFQTLLLTWGILIYALAVTGFWITSNSVIEATFEQQAREWGQKVAEISEPLFDTESGEHETFTQIKSYLASFSEISYAKFYRADNQVELAEFLSDDPGGVEIPNIDLSSFISSESRVAQIKSPDVSVLIARENLLRVIQPVAANRVTPDGLTREVTIGYIDLGINFGSYKDGIAKKILAGSVVISFIFLMAALVGRQLITNALRPLLDLQDPLHRLASGDTDVWVDRSGDEEIVAISNALNSTIRAIKGRDEELRRLADYDALTGLINKRSFDGILECELQNVINSRNSSALLYIDLDQFKYINDTLGHAAGDRLLIQVAELLVSRMRSDDVVCRLGGDEFAILARHVDKDGAIEIATALVKSMYDFLFVEQGKAFNIYCSVGVALIENDAYSADDIFSNADMACYAAKSQGRNRFNLYEPLDADKNKMDIGWSHRIAHALTNDKFMLHYQPIIGFSAGEMPAFEVLLRMQGDAGDVIPPNMFMPIAERFGLATEIDYWVIKRSMEILEKMNKSGKRARFYVNLSGQLLVDTDFVDRVLRIYRELSIDAEQIVFELTERAAVGNIHAASKKMQALRSHGFRFAVDDFGSGFSSFSYLKHMPVEYVKIEGEFVERIMNDDVDCAMVRSMVDIAKACGKRVVAEYVCDQGTLDLLREFGIDYAQGFFLAVPAAEPNFASHFRHGAAALAVSASIYKT